MEFNVTSGSRFNIITGKDTNGDGFFNERPAFATDLTKPNLVTTKYGVLDPNPTSNSNIIPRNLGKGPMNVSFDANLSKSIGFMKDAKSKKPKYSLNFSIYVNNIFNIVNKGNPIGNISSPYFLRTLSNSFANFTFENDTFERTAGGSGRSFNFNTSFRF